MPPESPTAMDCLDSSCGEEESSSKLEHMSKEPVSALPQPTGTPERPVGVGEDVETYTDVEIQLHETLTSQLIFNSTTLKEVSLGVDGNKPEPPHASETSRGSAGVNHDNHDNHTYRSMIELDEEDHPTRNCETDTDVSPSACFEALPLEILYHVLTFLDVNDLLAMSRVNHVLRSLSLTPLLHRHRLLRARILLPPLLTSPCRPTLASLIARSIFLTRTTIISRRLARSLVAIRLARRLAARPSLDALVDRAVLPRECVPVGVGCSRGGGCHVAPGLVARRREVERERVKDVLRRWVAGKWRGQVREREEGVRRLEESRGVGRVWRMRRFWERVGRGETMAMESRS